MLPTTKRSQWIIGLTLGLLIIVTRGHHFATLQWLPGATWAAMFIAGVYLRPTAALAALLMLTWLLDFAAFRWGGASGFCLTPAYLFLLPAYSALWLAGRWYRSQHQFAWRSLALLCLTVLIGSATCEIFSSGGFYFFSGRFDNPTLVTFGERLVHFFPLNLQSMAFYLSISVVLHAFVTFAYNTTTNKQQFAKP